MRDLEEHRELDGRDDARHLRSWLATMAAIAPPGFHWDVRMWDGAYEAEPALAASRLARTRVFEDDDGTVVAALLWDHSEEIHPEVHPDHRHLEPALVRRGEQVARAMGRSRTRVIAWEHDPVRPAWLEKAGYVRTTSWACLYRHHLGTSTPPAASLPTGYRIRTATDEDAEALAALQNAAFERSRHTADELLDLRRHAPSHAPDLDLLVEAPDGRPAAYAPLAWDPVNARGIVEPVCTHPDHGRRGLAGALLHEGFRRARARGALIVDVNSGDAAPANALYNAVGFEERYRAWFWEQSAWAS